MSTQTKLICAAFYAVAAIVIAVAVYRLDPASEVYKAALDAEARQAMPGITR